MTDKCVICGKDNPNKRSDTCSEECKSINKKNYRERKKNTGGSCSRCKEECGVRKKYCSGCLAIVKAELIRQKYTGVKQSEEQIRKRIESTDQKQKELKKQQTLLDRYGVDSPSKIPEAAKKIGDASRGRKKPRSKEHQDKIIQTKIRNGTTKATEETKEKISKTLKEGYASGRIQVTKLNEPLAVRHKTGYIDGLYFRSSYEEKFILFCKKYGIKIESASTGERAVQYEDKEGKLRRYFPDFYLPEYDTTVEIKPHTMLEECGNDLKILAGCTNIHNYVVLTEVDGILWEDQWDELYEEVCRWA